MSQATFTKQEVDLLNEVINDYNELLVHMAKAGKFRWSLEKFRDRIGKMTGCGSMLVWCAPSYIQNSPLMTNKIKITLTDQHAAMKSAIIP